MAELKLPDIVTLDEWHAEIDKLRIKEKGTDARTRHRQCPTSSFTNGEDRQALRV